MTKRQNLIDLAWHEKEAQKKSSFAYTVLNPDKSECLGCVYLYPCDDKSYELEISYWVTREAYKRGLYKIIGNDLKKWVRKHWPFDKVKWKK